MSATVQGIHLQGTHASRPAANAAGLPFGALYECTTHLLTYTTDGSSWTTYITEVSETNITSVLTDVTTGNVSTSKHGYAPKLPNDATKYLDGTGAYSVPSGGGGGSGGAGVKPYQVVEFGTGATNTATIAAAASGHLLWVLLDSFSTADPASMTATNCTFTKLKTTTDGAGALYSLWCGKVAGGSSGTTITFTNSNTAMSGIIIETDDPTSVTPSLTNSATADRSGGSDQQAEGILGLGANATAGKMAVFYAAPANTSAGNGAMIFPSIQTIGICGARCVLALGVIPAAGPLSLGMMIFQPTGSHFLQAILEVG